jgi:hypothetical protein
MAHAPVAEVAGALHGHRLHVKGVEITAPRLRVVSSLPAHHVRGVVHVLGSRRHLRLWVLDNSHWQRGILRGSRRGGDHHEQQTCEGGATGHGGERCGARCAARTRAREGRSVDEVRVKGRIYDFERKPRVKSFATPRAASPSAGTCLLCILCAEWRARGVGAAAIE